MPDEIPFEIKGHDLRVAAGIIGCGLTKIRELVRDGELESYPIGRRILVTGRAILEYQNRKKSPTTTTE